MFRKIHPAGRNGITIIKLAEQKTVYNILEENICIPTLLVMFFKL